MQESNSIIEFSLFPVPTDNLCGEYSKLNCNILYIVGIIVWGVHWQKAEHVLADLAYVPAILYDNLKTIKERCKSFLFVTA